MLNILLGILLLSHTGKSNLSGCHGIKIKRKTLTALIILPKHEKRQLFTYQWSIVGCFWYDWCSLIITGVFLCIFHKRTADTITYSVLNQTCQIDIIAVTLTHGMGLFFFFHSIDDSHSISSEHEVILLINNNPEETAVLLLSCFEMIRIIPPASFFSFPSLFISLVLFSLSFNCRTAHVGCALNLMKWHNSPN